jgi:hypothetical protein
VARVERLVVDEYNLVVVPLLAAEAGKRQNLGV